MSVAASTANSSFAHSGFSWYSEFKTKKVFHISFMFHYYILVHPAPEFKNVVKLSILVYIPSTLALTPYTLQNSPTEAVCDIMKSYYPYYDLDDVVVAGKATVFEWSAALAVIYTVVPCPFVYLVILYYRKKTLDYLDKAASNLSAETKKQHRKMIKALAIQTCVPIFYLGGATQYALGTFHFISRPIVEHGTFMSMKVMPMVTPLISLYFIALYRKVFLDWVGLSKLAKESSTVTPAVSSQSGAEVKASIHDIV